MKNDIILPLFDNDVIDWSFGIRGDIDISHMFNSLWLNDIT